MSPVQALQERAVLFWEMAASLNDAFGSKQMKAMKKLCRSQTDKRIAGICGGLGEMFSIDSTLIRLGLVFIAVTLIVVQGAVGILPICIAYIVGWIIVPVAPPQEDEDEGISVKRLYRSQTDKKLAGICGGLGEIFSIDSTLIRLVVVFIGLVTAIVPVVVAYIVGWMIIPMGPPQQDQDEKNVTPA